MTNSTRLRVVAGGLLVVWSLAAGPRAQQAKPTATGEQAAAEKAPKKEPHKVIGTMPFSYSYPETLARARENGKPILAYFTYDG